MVASVSPSVQQQVPLSNTFQPGGNDQSREVREDNKENTGTASTSTAQTQPSEARNNGRTEVKQASNEGTEERSSSSSNRGNNLDITV